MSSGNNQDEGCHVDDCSSSSSSSQWDEMVENVSPSTQATLESPDAQRQRLFSFDEEYQESVVREEESENDASNVPTDQERQILLLMLLAQVCALHDPTPRTFTVHVLELFERGILDRRSIHFLFELGLVPATSPTNLLMPPPTENNALMLSKNVGFLRQRSMEASAIRTTLEHDEKERTMRKMLSDPTPTPWSAKHYPLSLSRYQREFEQVRLLSEGSFGQVFQATSKMDGRDYAVKRVPFAAVGYSRESVQQVLREVQCLAACDHPNVVRYYTSWLEPSWMTGSGHTESARLQSGENLKLLQDVQMLVTASDSSGPMKDYFKDPMFSDRSRRRRYSSSDSPSVSSWGGHGEYSEWTVEQEHSKDDSYLEWNYGRDSYGKSRSRGNTRPKKRPPGYRYQICLFIQMQLCHPATLADWIRERNRQIVGGIETRMETANEIFKQIVSGLYHVHKKGIVHRDLKPANIFASTDDGFQFKLGDFGLSKLISKSVSSATPVSCRWRRQQQLLIEYGHVEFTAHSHEQDNSTWKDPLTAGVGTASYAAPEQIATKTYGTAADIFSLGLILLEVLCSFSTEHERLQTFHDCRHRRKLPKDVENCDAAARIILSCTEPVARDRPTANELKDVNLMAEENPPSNQHEVENLRKTLRERDREIEECKDALKEKDRMIERLLHELDLMKRNQAPVKDTGPVVVTGLSAQSDSSTEDEM